MTYGILRKPETHYRKVCVSCEGRKLCAPYSYANVDNCMHFRRTQARANRG